jgi:hypothetical protein
VFPRVRNGSREIDKTRLDVIYARWTRRRWFARSNAVEGDQFRALKIERHDFRNYVIKPRKGMR